MSGRARREGARGRRLPEADAGKGRRLRAQPGAPAREGPAFTGPDRPRLPGPLLPELGLLEGWAGLGWPPPPAPGLR